MENRLLSALPKADYDLLVPDLEVLPLDPESSLSRAGEPIEHVYFPHSGVVSLMIHMANGKAVATASIGREGGIGLLSVLGPAPSAVTALVHAPGTASRIRASRFYAAFKIGRAHV